MLSGGHLPDDVGEAMPDGVLEAVMADAARKIRRGSDVRSALWSSVRTHWEADLFEHFEVDRTYGDIYWPLVMSSNDFDLDYVVEVLAKVRSRDEALGIDVDLVGELQAPYPSDRCIFCGLGLERDETSIQRAGVHRSCEAEYGRLCAALARTDRVKGEPGLGDGHLEASSKSSSGRESLCESASTQADRCIEGSQAEDLLGIFEGEMYLENAGPA